MVSFIYGHVLANTSYNTIPRISCNFDNNQPIDLPLTRSVLMSFSPDRKLSAVACNDNALAYTLDVIVKLKQICLDDLLLDQPDVSLFAAVATRRPTQSYPRYMIPTPPFPLASKLAV
ncbi:hypothetical protein BDR06DRAFT_946967 [Suillus hirtellus]|nr:hypothetical protein BDR06DRAFT_946967 [Suillus hirtellus]